MAVPRKTPMTRRVLETINYALALYQASPEMAENLGVSEAEFERRVEQARKAVWDRLGEDF